MRHPCAYAIAALAIVCSGFAGAANATQYEVTGSVTINGANSGDLPAGASFGDATYNPLNGDLSTGKFVFPQATVGFEYGGSTGTVTYQLTQTNTSQAFVGDDGLAFLSNANVSLRAISAALGVFLDLGTDCIFGPIRFNNLWGSRTANGLEFMQASFSVPPTTGYCGGYKDQINEQVAGSDNSIALIIHGTFALPTHSDLLFMNGFEP